MPGLWTLGCVLGRYDLAQSFDVASAAISANSGQSAVNSWMKGTSQSSVNYITSTHSSAQGLTVWIDSDGGSPNALIYKYGAANDAHERWFPDIATHNMRVTAWGRFSSMQRSGWSRLAILDSAGSSGMPIPFTSLALAPITVERTNVTSNGDYPHVAISRVVSSGAASTIDDFIAQTDWIQLFPEIGFADESPFLFESAGALGGRRDFFRWGRTFAWQVPLKYLSDSDASLLTWWWRNQFALAFTLDTSDAATVQLCRIVNDDNPVRRRMRPYGNRWEGGLMLESLHDGRLAL